MLTQELLPLFCSDSSRQHMQQIRLQGIPAPLDDLRLADVSSWCGQEKGIEMPTKTCQAHVA